MTILKCSDCSFWSACDQELAIHWSANHRKKPDEGVKHDSGKPPISMIPRAALNPEALVFGYGATKYGKNNYKAGMKWSRMLDASLRHITAFADGEDTDPESGLSHLAHARAGLAMLLYYIENGVGEDDRK